jgi:hypothetical protein
MTPAHEQFVYSLSARNKAGDFRALFAKAKEAKKDAAWHSSTLLLISPAPDA